MSPLAELFEYLNRNPRLRVAALVLHTILVGSLWALIILLPR